MIGAGRAFCAVSFESSAAFFWRSFRHQIAVRYESP